MSSKEFSFGLSFKRFELLFDFFEDFLLLLLALLGDDVVGFSDRLDKLFGFR